MERKIPEDFINKIFELSAGALPQDSLDKIFALFESEASMRHFTQSSWSNLLRIILYMYDKVSFLNECLKYPNYVEYLTAIATNSNYLTDILVRNPEYFYWISNPSTLSTKFTDESFIKTVKDAITPYKSLTSKVNILRTIKRKEILRIGTKDILGYASLQEIINELSTLARYLLQELFSICYNEILGKYKIHDITNKYCVIALGKLGGNELNYSSDVDLIIFYNEDAHVTKDKGYQEILTEAIHLFIENASSVTPAGYIYRVDLRLRPDGRNSALTRSLTAYLNYYESRGDDWERQMLIKADFICGNRELYNLFMNFLMPFIYPSTFLVSPTEQIKNLKINIEKSLGNEQNIKLIPGGIRDTEFSVQALQLINGGKVKKIRTGNTLEAIQKLKNNKLLNTNETDTLSEGYIFYRRIEHFLQLMNDLQTHIIPESGEILEKLSSFLKFKNSNDFKRQVAYFRKSIKKIYNSIMGINLAPQKFSMKYSDINFENFSRAEKELNFLSDGKGLLGQKQFDKESRENFKYIEFCLFEYLRKSLLPDLVLQNFVRVIRSVNFPSIWYKEFRDKKIFISFLTICEFSQKAIDLFAEDQELQEYFLTRKVFEKIATKDLSSFSLKKITFIIAVQLTMKLIDALQASKIISRFFTKKIHLIVDSIRNLNLKKTQFFVAAMGSLGMKEMTFTSDIDLIFVVKDLNIFPDTQKYFQLLLLKLKEELKPFDVDCRLRPEGKSSILVWELNKYIEYINNRARTWEFQAFIKLRYITGNKRLFSKLTGEISERIETLNQATVKKDILEMRKKLYPQFFPRVPERFNLKKSRGGLTDIEFIVQYLILCHSKIFNFIRAKGTLKAISILKEDNPAIEVLTNNYSFLKKLEILNQNIFNLTQPLLSSDNKKLRVLANRMGINSVNNFNEKLSVINIQNNSLLQKYIG